MLAISSPARDDISPEQMKLLNAMAAAIHVEERCQLKLNQSAMSDEMARTGFVLQDFGTEPFILVLHELNMAMAEEYSRVGKSRFCSKIIREFGSDGTVLPNVIR